MAAHRSRAAFTAGAGLDHDSFLRQELGEETVARFRGVLRGQGLDPDDYLFLPVHPWQWRNKLRWRWRMRGSTPIRCVSPATTP